MLFCLIVLSPLRYWFEHVDCECGHVSIRLLGRGGQFGVGCVVRGIFLFDGYPYIGRMIV